MPSYIPAHASKDVKVLPKGQHTKRKCLSPNAVSVAAAYTPPKPEKDLEMSEKIDEDTPAKVAAYIPKHTAAEHTQTSKTTSINVDPDHPLLRKVGILPSGTVDHAHQDSMDAYDSSDYENFLQAYRVAMTRVTMSRKTPTTIDIKPMRDASERSSHRVSFSSSSPSSPTSPTARRGSLANSVFDKIGNYIKPVRRDSLASQLSGQTAITTPAMSRRGSAMTSRRGSAMSPEECKARWSQSSPSEIGMRDRDALAIEKQVRDSWNSRLHPPPSPGLKRFSSHTRQ